MVEVIWSWKKSRKRDDYFVPTRDHVRRRWRFVVGMRGMFNVALDTAAHTLSTNCPDGSEDFSLFTLSTMVFLLLSHFNQNTCGCVWVKPLQKNRDSSPLSIAVTPAASSHFILHFIRYRKW